MPKLMVIGYFKNNKNDFNYIVNYFKEKPEPFSFDTTKSEVAEVFRLDDKNCSIKILKTFYIGLFERVSYYSSEKGAERVEFYISNLFLRIGEPLSIVYSEEPMQDEYYYGDWELDYIIKYQQIDKNWYYSYKSK